MDRKKFYVIEVYSSIVIKNVLRIEVLRSGIKINF